MVAVIKTGGKQYLVEEGDVITVEKIEGDAGKTVTFTDVLLRGDDTAVTVGTPTIDGCVVEGKIVDQDRAAKVWGLKFKRRKRYRITFGHRQPITHVEITAIDGASSAQKRKPTTKKTEKKASVTE